MEVSLVRSTGWWISLWDLATGVLNISAAHDRGIYPVPKLPDWSCLLILVCADSVALVLLTL